MLAVDDDIKKAAKRWRDDIDRELKKADATVKVDADAKEAEKKLDKLEKDTHTATVDVELDGAEAEAELDALTRDRKVEVTADAVSAAGGSVPDALDNILAAAALLAAHSAPSDPARRIVAAAVAGELTEKRLDAMLADYATAALASSTRGELRQRSEKLFVERWHRALADGAAEEILNSLRPAYHEHVETIAAAMTLIPPSGSPNLTARSKAAQGISKFDVNRPPTDGRGPIRRVGDFGPLAQATPDVVTRRCCWYRPHRHRRPRRARR